MVITLVRLLSLHNDSFYDAGAGRKMRFSLICYWFSAIHTWVSCFGLGLRWGVKQQRVVVVLYSLLLAHVHAPSVRFAHLVSLLVIIVLLRLSLLHRQTIRNL